MHGVTIKKTNTSVFFVIKPTRCTNLKNLFCHELYMFRSFRLSFIRSLFTVHSAMVYVIQFRAGANAPARMHSTNLLWHISLLSVQWINSWWWTEELPETCRVSWQNKFVKLVYLVGFITKKSVTMHVTSYERKTYQYKNIKEKLYKTIAAIWYNKTCRQKEVTANCVWNKINGNSHQCLNTI
jgi:hypothetical protein